MDPSHEYVRLSCTSLCACGGTHGDNEECLAGKPANADDALAGAMAQGMLHGLFPEHGLRRAFVKTLGRAGALAALTALTPLTQLAAVAHQWGVNWSTSDVRRRLQDGGPAGRGRAA